MACRKTGVWHKILAMTKFKMLGCLVPLGFAALFSTALLCAQDTTAEKTSPQEITASKPFLWRIETVPPSYMFGTIHLPDKRVTTLPASVQEALDAADAVFTEIPLEDSNMMKAQQLVMLPGKKSLQTELPEELYGRLETFLKKKGMSMFLFNKMKPWSLATLLSMLDKMEMMQKEALDKKLYRLAKTAKKRVGGLETIQEQVGVFDSLTAEQQVMFLSVSLDMAKEADEKGEDPLEELLLIYLKGDAEDLMDEMNDYDMGKDSPELQKLEDIIIERLLTNRNRNMAHRMVAMMQESPGSSFFFAIGAAHYPGETGLLQLLRKRGYRITRLGAGTGAGAIERQEAMRQRMRELEEEQRRISEELGQLKKAG